MILFLLLTRLKMPGIISIQQNVYERMQVLQLACDELLFIPAFRSVRHLVVEQRDMDQVIKSLPCLPLLNTLSLRRSEDKHSAVR